jgi:hypothetical protein
VPGLYGWYKPGPFIAVSGEDPEPELKSLKITVIAVRFVTADLPC